MKTDMSREKLIEFYEELPRDKKAEALDFVEWLWINKENKFFKKKSMPDWFKKLYLSFADIRQETKKSPSRKVDMDIRKAIKEVRRQDA